MSEWRETEIGKIPQNWNVVTVDYIKSPEKKSIISGPFGSNISAKFFVEDGVPVIRGNNLSLSLSEKFKDEGFVFITNEKANELSTWAEVNDIVFTAVGTIGQVGIILKNQKYEKYIISNKQLRLTVDENKILPIFCYYWFASPRMTNVIIQRNTGSSVPLINLSILKSLLLPLPPLPEQKAIASVLSSLDDKIDLLHRQNKTLGAMAETLFRQWFVEGANESWEEGTLDDILTVKGGSTPSTKNPDFWDGDIYWTSPRDITTLNHIHLFDTERKITEDGLTKISSGVLPQGTLLMSSRAPVGVLAFAEIPLAINQGYIAILDNKGFSKEFIYFWLKINMDYVHSYANGSTFQEISKSSFKSLNIQLPPEDKRNNFQDFVSPLLGKIKANTIQIAHIENQRNSLLPKLMNGEAVVQ